MKTRLPLALAATALIIFAVARNADIQNSPAVSSLILAPGEAKVLPSFTQPKESKHIAALRPTTPESKLTPSETAQLVKMRQAGLSNDRLQIAPIIATLKATRHSHLTMIFTRYSLQHDKPFGLTRLKVPESADDIVVRTAEAADSSASSDAEFDCRRLR